MEQKEENSTRKSITNNFQGATIKNFVYNDHGTTNIYNQDEGKERGQGYSDEQVATALSRIVGKGKAIDSKQKWAGAIWLLRWVCNYPVNSKQACDRINQLPLPEDLEFPCDYSNIRGLATLSFMNEDARYLDQVKYSKNDEKQFYQMRSVVLALDEELKKTTQITE